MDPVASIWHYLHFFFYDGRENLFVRFEWVCLRSPSHDLQGRAMESESLVKVRDIPEFSEECLNVD